MDAVFEGAIGVDKERNVERGDNGVGFCKQIDTHHLNDEHSLCLQQHGQRADSSEGMHMRKPCASDTAVLDTAFAPHSPISICGPYSAAPTDATDIHCTHAIVGVALKPTMAAASANVHAVTTRCF